MKNIDLRFGVLVGIVLLAAFSRLLPHPPNFTPIIAIALFGGAYFANKKFAFIVPLVAMALSDIGLSFILGYELFTDMRLVIYGTFILITLIGMRVGNKIKLSKIVIGALGSAVLFFIMTNFAVWAGDTHNMYPKSIVGLTECYVAAIPFFWNTLIGTMVYAGVLFGGFELAKFKFPALSKVKA